MKITRIVQAAPALLLFAIGTVNAEFIGVNIGASSNGAPYSSISSSIDLVDDLGVERGQQSSMILILEHPIAALPNIRYKGYNLDSTDTSSTLPGVNFNGGGLGAGNVSTSSFDLNQDDIVLYYQLLNNWIDLDMGVDLKRFDGRISSGAMLTNDIEVDETIPLLHLSARVALPISGLYIGADISSNFVDLGISESTAQDSTLMLGYESRNGLGIEGGIKSFSVQLNDTDKLNTELEYDGLFVNGYYNF